MTLGTDLSCCVAVRVTTTAYLDYLLLSCGWVVDSRHGRYYTALGYVLIPAAAY